MEEKHGRELASDVFAGACASGIALLAKALHANTSFGGIDDGTPEDEGIGGTGEESIVFDFLMHGGAEGEVGA